MLEEKKPRKNPDYSASAVMLTNSPQVMDLLARYHREASGLMELTELIEKAIPQDLKEHKATLEKIHQATDKSIRQAIDEFGSYQNTETGEYALKQKRESINYKPELVRQYAPSKVASFVLVESVDSKAMEAMLKTGRLSPEQARQCGEIKESFAYIVK